MRFPELKKPEASISWYFSGAFERTKKRKVALSISMSIRTKYKNKAINTKNKKTRTFIYNTEAIWIIKS